MFRKNNTPNVPAKLNAGGGKGKKECTLSIITQDINVLGNVVSDGAIDFDGTLNGNIRCATLTIRANGFVKGEVVADDVTVYGKVKGLIRARNVHLCASSNVEGIVMHETLRIEDGAFIDGKCKRTDKIQMQEESEEGSESSGSVFPFDETSAQGTKILENIRLIR